MAAFRQYLHHKLLSVGERCWFHPTSLCAWGYNESSNLPVKHRSHSNCTSNSHIERLHERCDFHSLQFNTQKILYPRHLFMIARAPRQTASNATSESDLCEVVLDMQVSFLNATLFITFSSHVSMHGRCHVLSRLLQVSPAVLSCFTLYR